MWRKFLKKLNFSESYFSITLGFLVVLAGGILLLRYLKENSQKKSSPPGEIKFVEQKEEEKTTLPASHTVQKGENLWRIAERYYGSGYNWVTIAAENKLKNPDKIFVGQILSIPKAQTIRPMAEKIASEATSAATTYKVVKGDYLWKIALREYGNGFLWVKIAKENQLKDPDLIYPGNILRLPR